MGTIRQLAKWLMVGLGIVLAVQFVRMPKNHPNRTIKTRPAASTFVATVPSTTTTRPEPVVETAPPVAASVPPLATPVPTRTVWDDLADCLTSGDWAWHHDGVAASGGLKLLPVDLRDAWSHTREEQIAAAEQVYAKRGNWSYWLGCARQIGITP